jgi:hypothetical protein
VNEELDVAQRNSDDEILARYGKFGHLTWRARHGECLVNNGGDAAGPWRRLLTVDVAVGDETEVVNRRVENMLEGLKLASVLETCLLETRDEVGTDDTTDQRVTTISDATTVECDDTSIWPFNGSRWDHLSTEIGGSLPFLPFRPALVLLPPGRSTTRAWVEWL